MNTSSPESVASQHCPEASTAPVSQVSKPAVSQPSKPAGKHRPHRSKISNLPTAIRDFINESIHNHIPYMKIIQSLAQKGHPDIKPGNLTLWSKSGYQLWLNQRERFECLRLKIEDAEKLFADLEATGKHHADLLNSRFINLHMVQAMRDFDPNHLTDLLQKDPLTFFKFVRANHAQSLARQRDDRLEVLRHKAGIGRKTGPNERGRQAVKAAFNLPDSWFNSPETPQRSA